MQHFTSVGIACHLQWCTTHKKGQRDDIHKTIKVRGTHLNQLSLQTERGEVGKVNARSLLQVSRAKEKLKTASYLS